MVGYLLFRENFDRQPDCAPSQKRIADTTHGANAENGSSYLELAQLLTRYGSKPQDDLPELWRRIAFSVAVSNTDDHLRNHGFLLSNQGWRLSPAYDLNPNPDGMGLSLNISEIDNALDFDLVMEGAPMFRLSADEARKMLKRIRSTVKQFKSYARRAGLSQREQDRMQTAFRF